jgi:DegT/DnrJ/EryC1/StrS aminotransferase family
VVVPSLSFIATANAARHVGATPVFADVDAQTQNLTAKTIEQVFSAATRAVIVVHQGGTPADLDAVHQLCDPLGVAVVEDAACAIGATYKGRPIGDDAKLTAFSFHPRMVLTTGEGGMVTTHPGGLGGAPAPATRARHERQRGGQAHQWTASDRPVPGDRLQLPHDRYPGRDRAGATGTPRRDRRAPTHARGPLPRAVGRRARPGDGRRPGLRHHRLPVVLGGPARRLPESRNSCSVG